MFHGVINVVRKVYRLLNWIKRSFSRIWRGYSLDLDASSDLKSFCFTQTRHVLVFFIMLCIMFFPYRVARPGIQLQNVANEVLNVWPQRTLVVQQHATLAGAFYQHWHPKVAQYTVPLILLSRRSNTKSPRTHKHEESRSRSRDLKGSLNQHNFTYICESENIEWFSAVRFLLAVGSPGADYMRSAMLYICDSVAQCRQYSSLASCHKKYMPSSFQSLNRSQSKYHTAVTKCYSLAGGHLRSQGRDLWWLHTRALTSIGGKNTVRMLASADR